jgi:hypothetical protein
MALRLGDHNKSILDYLLMPATCTDRIAIRFSENDRARLGMSCFETSDALVQCISQRLTKRGHVSRAKPTRPHKQPRSAQTKGIAGRARH